jgi:hypothetical protein
VLANDRKDPLLDLLGWFKEQSFHRCVNETEFTHEIRHSIANTYLDVETVHDESVSMVIADLARSRYGYRSADLRTLSRLVLEEVQEDRNGLRKIAESQQVEPHGLCILAEAALGHLT